jgi:hypothetical protein
MPPRTKKRKPSEVVTNPISDAAMAPVPGEQETLGLTCTLHSLATAEWEIDFINYYAESRKYEKEVLRAAREVLNTTSMSYEKRKKWLEGAKAAFRGTGKDGKGTLGEAHFSYLMERKKSIFLTQATWKQDPFQVSKGIDLVGVLVPDMIVCHIEVKAWAARKESDIRSAFKELTENQLPLSRLQALLQGAPNPGHHKVVIAEFLRRIREGVIHVEGAALSRLPENLADRLLRIGGVVAEHAGGFPGKISGPSDTNADWPCELILLSVEDLTDKLVRLTGIEQELQAQQFSRDFRKLNAGAEPTRGETVER